MQSFQRESFNLFPPQIIGGRRAAAEYRVEIDLSSEEEQDSSLTFRGPVLPMDEIPDD